MNQALDEESIISDFFVPLARDWPGAYVLADDCSTLAVAPGHELVVKTDPIRAGIHFFSDDRPADIAWKALAVNVSDLASKAARPVAYTLAICFPAQPSRSWLRDFTAGLSEAQEHFGCTLIGGDTDHATGPMSLAITVFGEVPRGKMVRRATPSVGDRILVSGTLGDAALGLRLRANIVDGKKPEQITDHESHLVHRYLRPKPYLELRSGLRAYATAAMDLSDGLGKDLGRMCRASGTGATVYESDIPLSDAFIAVAPKSQEERRSLISFGDDYEVLCTVRADNVVNFVALAASSGVVVTEIGIMTTKPGVTLIDRAGKAQDWAGRGYDHFSRSR